MMQVIAGMEGAGERDMMLIFFLLSMCQRNIKEIQITVLYDVLG